MTRAPARRMCHLVESGESQLVRLHQTIAPGSCYALEYREIFFVLATWISGISAMRASRVAGDAQRDDEPRVHSGRRVNGL